VIKRKLQDVLEMVGGMPSPHFNGEREINGVSTDSRNIQAGQLYVPLVGEKFDGHDFVGDVCNKGAACLFWQKDHGPTPADVSAIIVEDTLKALQQLAATYRQQLPLKVIGITGSNGKTTTKDMVAAIAATTYRVHKTAGNFNNHIGLPLTILSMDEQCEVLILEMGMSDFGEIEQLSLIARPDAAVITIIGESHMLQLGSRKGIAQAKLEIVAGLKPGGLLILPGNEPLLQALIEEQGLAEKFEIVRFGDGSLNDFYLTGVMVQAEHTSFTINLNDQVYTVPMAGEHNAFNALAAIAIGNWLKVQPEQAQLGLKQMVPTGMRMEVVKTVTGLTVMNDAYNASPTSMKAAIEWIGMLNGYRRKFVVLGDMLELGPNAEMFHREMGKLLTPKVVDAVLTYGPQAAWIAEEAKVHFDEENVQHFDDHAAIAEVIRAHTNEQDIVLVKASRGMKLEQVIAFLK
jgi:UDP-N-acetylmuramoyl-tripeptide--D-alanyl-D-alanine ligase